MDNMTKQQAFAKALAKLKVTKATRMPVFAFCKIRITEKAEGRLLDLFDGPGEDGRIGAIWMDGLRVGELTKRDRHASRKLDKTHFDDLKFRIRQARLAEAAKDIPARNRELRAASISVISYFSGEVQQAYQAFGKVGMPLKKKPGDREPGLKAMVSSVSDYSRKIGDFVPAPRLRIWAFRDVSAHSEAQKDDPIRRTRTVSAIDVNRMNITIDEVQSEVVEMQRFINRLWQCLKRHKRQFRSGAKAQS